MSWLDTLFSKAYVLLQAAGVPQTQRQVLNFTGAGVTVTDNSVNGSTDVDIPAAAPTGGKSILLWGNNSVNASITTRSLTPGYSDTAAGTNIVQIVIPVDGTLRNMYARHNVTAGNGDAIVYTVWVNGVATALAVSLASTTQNGSDLVDTVAVLAGDLVDIAVTKALAVVTSPSDVAVTLELDA